MVITNPKIDGSNATVETLLDDLPRKNPDKITIDGDIPIPPWFSFNPIHSIEWHVQGVAPYNNLGDGTIGNGCFSGSSDTGYFATFSQASGHNPNVQQVVTAGSDTNYFHCGGVQLLGDLMAMPLESSDSDENAIIKFYNIEQMASPELLYTLQTGHKKASAVAITNYTDGNGDEQVIMMVYEYDHRDMYIWKAPAGSVSSNSWTYVHKYNGSAFHGDQYQNFALVTQTGSGDDEVYLCGFREDEELHLFQIDVSSSSNYGKPTEIINMTGWNGSDWRYGVGLQIPSATELRVIGSDKDPSGSNDGNYTLNIYVWQ